eukprot:CAMPEP_0176279212 /NCGR_PEP_ID=MMETSP0121_2-20121125/49172_1 /TAXON_ID=160619 /ORGANISM="Kryptoperidinium foliaceum, Strain CCMP 1326" /LENGTH=528 /DNA_ID=CAMNT_0017619527 /DNA_START=184 /DNA_END=1766 /DNA_ORIENTATION=+
MTRSERRLFPRLSRHLAAHQEMLGTARRSCGGARPEAEPALRRLAARQEEVDGEQRHHADHAGGDHGQGEDERHHPEDGAEERDACAEGKRRGDGLVEYPRRRNGASAEAARRDDHHRLQGHARGAEQHQHRLPIPERDLQTREEEHEPGRADPPCQPRVREVGGEDVRDPAVAPREQAVQLLRRRRVEHAAPTLKGCAQRGKHHLGGALLDGLLAGLLHHAGLVRHRAVDGHVRLPEVEVGGQRAAQLQAAGRRLAVLERHQGVAALHARGGEDASRVARHTEETHTDVPEGRLLDPPVPLVVERCAAVDVPGDLPREGEGVLDAEGVAPIAGVAREDGREALAHLRGEGLPDALEAGEVRGGHPELPEARLLGHGLRALHLRRGLAPIALAAEEALRRPPVQWPEGLHLNSEGHGGWERLHAPSGQGEAIPQRDHEGAADDVQGPLAARALHPGELPHRLHEQLQHPHCAALVCPQQREGGKGHEAAQRLARAGDTGVGGHAQGHRRRRIEDRHEGWAGRHRGVPR